MGYPQPTQPQMMMQPQGQVMMQPQVMYAQPPQKKRSNKCKIITAVVVVLVIIAIIVAVMMTLPCNRLYNKMVDMGAPSAEASRVTSLMSQSQCSTALDLVAARGL